MKLSKKLENYTSCVLYSTMQFKKKNLITEMDDGVSSGRKEGCC